MDLQSDATNSELFRYTDNLPLLNLNVQEFQNEYWERKPVMSGTLGCEPLLSASEVNDILFRHPHRLSNVRLVRNGEVVPAEDYAMPASKRATLTPQDTFVRMDLVAAYFKQGYTIVLRDVDIVSNTVQKACSDLGDILRVRCNANLYVTPKQSSGLKPHYDAHCVICHQVLGSKQWQLFPAGTLLATPTVAFQDQPSPLSESETITTTSGKSLYIPRGKLHAAHASDQISAHLTFGLHIPSVADLLRAAVSIAEEMNDELRESLDLSLSGNEYGQIRATAEGVVNQLLSAEVLQAAYAMVFSDLAMSAKTNRSGSLESMISKTPINDETVVSRSYFGPLFMTPAGDQIEIAVSGATFGVPCQLGPALRSVFFGKQSVLVGELPGIASAQSRALLVDQLAEWGLVTLTQAGASQ